MRDERSDGRAEETGRNGRWKIHRGWKPAADHLVDRLTRRVSVFEGPDCEKCIVLSREIGVVKYAALELSRAKRTRSWPERGRERETARASWARRIIYWLINEDVLHYGSSSSRGRLLSLGTGIIWRPNIYDRVLLLPVDPGPPPRYRCRCRCWCRSRCRSRCSCFPSASPLPASSETNRAREGRRGPITTCPDLTAIRGTWNFPWPCPTTRNSRALLFGQRIALKSLAKVSSRPSSPL